MRSLWSEFKAFAFSGNLLDVAIGIAIGLAFATVVDSLVGDVIMPVVAAIFGAPDFSGLSVEVNDSEIRYGAFLTALLAFLLLALVLLFLVKGVKRATGKEAAGAQGNRECDHCKSFIPVDASVCMYCTRDVDPLVA